MEERAQRSSRPHKSSDNSPRSTPPAAHASAASPSASLPQRLDAIQTPHPPHSNPHSLRRAANVPPPAVSSLGGLRTPAPVCAAPPSWAGIRNPSQKRRLCRAMITSALLRVTDITRHRDGVTWFGKLRWPLRTASCSSPRRSAPLAGSPDPIHCARRRRSPHRRREWRRSVEGLDWSLNE